MVERKNIFFAGENGLTLAKAKAEELRKDGKRDVVVTLKKNAEDAANGCWANARVEGAFVVWRV
jgi:hypothetical protein